MFKPQMTSHVNNGKSGPISIVLVHSQIAYYQEIKSEFSKREKCTLLIFSKHFYCFCYTNYKEFSSLTLS